MVEVVLALGIFSFALVGLMGLMPMGLQSLKDTTDMAAETRIMQRISNEIAQTNYESIESSIEYSFDAQGSPTTATSPECVYLVKVLIEKGTKLPGSSVATPNLAAATITITSPVKPGHVSVYPKLIAKRDADF